MFGYDFSWRDIILAAGGIFLLIKSIMEIHSKVEGDEHEHELKQITSFGYAIFQIVMLDIIFSFDSILTAVGLTDELLLNDNCRNSLYYCYDDLCQGHWRICE